MPIISNFPSSGAKKTILQIIKEKIIPTKSEQVFVPDEGYDGFEGFTVAAIPDEYHDVSGVSATAAGTLEGTSFVDADGNSINGEMVDNGDVSTSFDGITVKSVDIPTGYTDGGTVSLTDDIDNEVVIQADLLAQIQAALGGKAGSSSNGSDIVVVGDTIVKIANVTATSRDSLTFNRPEGETYNLSNVKCIIVYTDWIQFVDEDSDYYYICNIIGYRDDNYIEYCTCDIDGVIGNEDRWNTSRLYNFLLSESSITFNRKNASEWTSFALSPDTTYTMLAVLDGSENESTSGVDTSDANATSLDIREGTSGYVNGVKIEGDVPTRSSDDIMVEDTSVTIPAGIYDEDILKDISNFGGGTSITSLEEVSVTTEISDDDSYVTSLTINSIDTTNLIGMFLYSRYVPSPGVGCTFLSYFIDLVQCTMVGTGTHKMSSDSDPVVTNSINPHSGNILFENNSITINFDKSEEVVPIDNGYWKADLIYNNIDTPTETWVFTLEDGSTVEKEIEVGA